MSCSSRLAGWPACVRVVLCVFLFIGLWGAQWSAAQDVPQTSAGAASFLPGVYRGRLGDRDVQVELVIPGTALESLEGHYFVFGEGNNIELAGEFENDDVFLEESHNGVDVSGTWTGKFRGRHVFGTWADAQDQTHIPFDLQYIATSR